jgi:hypothetical protein
MDDAIMLNNSGKVDLPDVLIAARRRMDYQLFRAPPRTGPKPHVSRRPADGESHVVRASAGRTRGEVARAQPPPKKAITEYQDPATDSSRLRSALDSLSPSDVKLLMMRHVQRFTPARIAREMGVSERIIKCRLLRALLRLRGLLSPPF